MERSKEHRKVEYNISCVCPVVTGEGLDATIYGAMPTGMESTLKLKAGEYLITGVIFGSTAYKIGEEVKINLKGEDILLFDRQSGLRIASGRLEFDSRG